MSTIADDDRRVIAGVDTHKDFHVVVVLDELGRKLDTATFSTTARGYRDLTGWVTGFGEVLAIGVEGTASWGAGLCRHLRARGLERDRGEPARPAPAPPARASPTASTPRWPPGPCSPETRPRFPKPVTVRSRRCASSVWPARAR